jgi:hypothetical protein
MPDKHSGAIAALGAALCVLASSTALSIAPAQAAPGPDICQPASPGDACTATLTSVTANSTDGTITGTPVGGGSPVTLAGQAEAYLKSMGFGETPPDPVQQWDATIDRVTNVDPNSPEWYGNAKARAFMPRTLNDLATRLPPNVIVVRFVPDDNHPSWFNLVSIQPVAQ